MFQNSPSLSIGFGLRSKNKFRLDSIDSSDLVSSANENDDAIDDKVDPDFRFSDAELDYLGADDESEFTKYNAARKMRKRK